MRYLCYVSYDGSNYLGFQRQLKGKTIQGEIERSLLKMTKIKHDIHPSGRTDRNVHALEQTFHFDSDLPIEIPLWIQGLNRRLPKDIQVNKMKIVSDNFHARHDAKKKTYRYLISKEKVSVFKTNYISYVKDFDLSKIIDAHQYLEGTHDFKGFCQHENNKPTIKTVYKVSIKEQKTHYTIEITADGFLKYMVRSIVGLLIEIATNKKDLLDINKVLETKDRSLAGKPAEPQGLYLVKVYY